MTKKQSYFIVSLDFENAWGYQDKDLKDPQYKSCADKLKDPAVSVEKTLDLFEKYNIHATWATVGALFCKNKQETETLINTGLVYTETNFNMKDYLSNIIGQDEESDSLHYAASLIEKIRGYKHQEIASHTFSHFYTNYETNKTNDEDALEKELEAMREVCPEAKSMVFPRMLISDTAVELLKKYGYTSYRGNMEMESNRRKRSNPKKSSRLINFIKSYMSSGLLSYPAETVLDNGICNIRESAIFVPYYPKRPYMEKFKIRKIKLDMKKAAKKGHAYHIRWHPHDTGSHYDINFKQLDEIFAYYNKLAGKYGMISIGMKELAEKIMEGEQID